MTDSASPVPILLVPEPRILEILLAEEMKLVRERLAVLCNSIPGFCVVSQVGSGDGGPRQNRASVTPHCSPRSTAF
jgi:hypothetical protein